MEIDKRAFGGLKNKVGESIKKLVLGEAIGYLKKDSTIDKICHFVIDNDPSKELYDYLELRKQEGNENANQLFEMLVYRWPDLIEYLNTEEGQEKLLRMLRNINKWIDVVNIADQHYQQQQQQQLGIEGIKGRPTKTGEGKELEKKTKKIEPP